MSSTFCQVAIEFPDNKRVYVLYDVAGGKRKRVREKLLSSSEAAVENAQLLRAKRGLAWYPKIP